MSDEITKSVLPVDTQTTSSPKAVSVRLAHKKVFKGKRLVYNTANAKEAWLVDEGKVEFTLAEQEVSRTVLGKPVEGWAANSAPSNLKTEGAKLDFYRSNWLKSQ